VILTKTKLNPGESGKDRDYRDYKGGHYGHLVLTLISYVITIKPGDIA
jgi:hypothetical protein